MTRAVITTTDATFLPGAAALLIGVRRFHPDITRYCYVPGEDLETARAQLAGLAEVRAYPRRIRGVPDHMQVNAARLFMFELDEESVAYIDADCLMCRPCPRLWEVAPGRVNAVRDHSNMILSNVPGDLRDRFERQFPDACRRQGINGGVFALNPREWRDLPERFEQIVLTGKYRYERIFDQPLLSTLFMDKVDWLPRTYNAHYFYDFGVPFGVRIMHYTGPAKPWEPGFPKHEPAYYQWLRNGPVPASRATRFGALLRIAAATPKRVVALKLRHWRTGYR